jgi:hypothetical protein
MISLKGLAPFFSTWEQCKEFFKNFAKKLVKIGVLTKTLLNYAKMD